MCYQVPRETKTKYQYWKHSSLLILNKRLALDVVNLHCMLKTWIYVYITIQKHFFLKCQSHFLLLVNFFPIFGFLRKLLMEWTDLSVSAKEKLWEWACSSCCSDCLSIKKSSTGVNSSSSLWLESHDKDPSAEVMKAALF